MNISATEWFRLIGILGVIALVGCDAASEIAATPRPSGNTPVFASNQPAGGMETEGTSSWKKLAIEDHLSRDHFGCIRVNVADLKAQSSLKDFPWSDLDSALGDAIGAADADLPDVKSLWLLLDGELFKLDDPQACVVTIIEFSTSLDPALLKSGPENGKPAPSESRDGLAIEALNDTFVAWGNQAAILKLKGQNSVGRPSALVRELNLDSALTGVVTLGPIRSTLTSIFALFAMQPELKPFAALPDEIQTITFSSDLTEQQSFFALDVEIEDDKLRTTLEKTIVEALAEDFEMPTPDLSALPETLVPLTSPAPMTAVTQEIFQEDLIQVEDADGRLAVRLARPTRLNELLAAMIKDYRLQASIQRRQDNLRAIANALETYETEYGCLPPLTSIDEGATLPAQFGWRVGILPKLGLQDHYDRFDFSQPWDAAVNQKAAEDIPTVFQASESDDDRGTSIQLVRGTGRVYGELASLPKTSGVADRKIWTALAVEIPTAEGRWHQPRQNLEPIDVNTIGRPNENGLFVLTANFDVRVLRRESEKVEEILTIGGDEKFSRGDFLKLDP